MKVESQPPITVEKAYLEAVNHFYAQRYNEADKLCTAILQKMPDHIEALNLLGVIAQKVNRYDLAVDLFRKIIEINPNIASAYNNLGAAYKEQGKLEKASFNFTKSITIKPDYDEAHSNLANVLFEQGKLEEAVESCEASIALNVNCASAYFNLGNVKNEQGKTDIAIVNYQKAIAINPNYADALFNLGAVFQKDKKTLEATQCFKKVISINPSFANAHFSLAGVLYEAGEIDGSVASYKKTIKIKPDYEEAYLNLGAILNWQIKLEEAADCYKKAILLKPKDPAAYSCLFLCSQYMFNQTQENLFLMHKEFANVADNNLIVNKKSRNIDVSIKRKLQIGLVSPDLGFHPIGYFMTGFFKYYSRKELEITCYADHKNDELTQLLKSHCDNWVATDDISSDELAKVIARDNIDILIDLAGHTINNRLSTFAKKPAPIQMSWAGYVGTTGLPTMDWLIADKHYVPEDEDKFYTEKILRLPDSWVCYTPPWYVPDIAREQPQTTDIDNKQFILGCFANPAKINADMASVWAKILLKHPTAKLLLMYDKMDDAWNIKRVKNFFINEGVEQDRVIIEGKRPHRDFLARYNSVDLALDTLPYSGGLTTMEALLMGVVVVTTPGSTFAGRHAKSILYAVGLKELVAENLDEYVKLVSKLIDDPQRLQKLRQGLRERFLQSPLCDGQKFSNDFTHELRLIWKKWCENNS
ncbi:MAG: tetratricopeptide repeat protein [Magnetococcales bacterium]|nr:tetratricopeptide repeat protein [Magnetococcales bacterium]